MIIRQHLRVEKGFRFHKNKATYSGLEHRCKDCNSKRSKIRNSNPETRDAGRKYSAKWYRENKQRASDYQRKYIAIPEKRVGHNKSCRKSHHKHKDVRNADRRRNTLIGNYGITIHAHLLKLHKIASDNV